MRYWHVTKGEEEEQGTDMNEEVRKPRLNGSVSKISVTLTKKEKNQGENAENIFTVRGGAGGGGGREESCGADGTSAPPGTENKSRPVREKECL